jgi:hypothetical protein
VGVKSPARRIIILLESFAHPSDEEGEHPMLEASTKQRLVKTEKTLCVL